MRLRVDYKSGKPVYLQIVAQIKAAAAAGTLRPGEALPSIGAVAEELRVSRNGVARAYSELESTGVIEMAPGKGYCLKQDHRPLRKEVSRTEISPPPEHAVRPRRRTLQHAAAGFLVGAAYFIAVAVLAAWLVRAQIIRGERLAILATLVIAAALLPLRRRAQQAIERAMFPKRHAIPRALQALKSEIWSQPHLDSFIEHVVDSVEMIVGVRPELVRDRAELLALANSFPALRSAREPVRAGNDLLMPLFSNDEVIGVLHLAAKPAGQDYDLDDRDFLRGVGEQVAAAANQSRMRKDRAESEYALDIQRGLLPRDIPQVPGFSIAAAWQPAKAVGGDYYDVFPVSATELALVVADVSGKGIPAALLMSNLQATTKAYASMTTSPRELCDRVNRAICASIAAGKFITFFYGVLNADERRLTFTNAGHNPPLIVSANGNCRKLKTGDLVLGILPETTYHEATIDLLDGDRLIVFTDGVVEAADTDEREFGDDRLFTAATAAANVSANELRNSIMEAVTHFCHGDFADDATLLTVVVEAAARTAAPG